eukprot:CAMPEP_0184027426 /NCGR_PEP_ID=MMETSP0954-20121128/14183_1 /TAXON_ID=627963 /ORGANISM="Aplanochytrium sp, Strain PBS07" /LENGTH=255 /DNA_ID=CAMNT_0026311967 /DNA_START=607 /DNA_END=1374 /DNA_ORIENTATION=-
MIQPFPSAVGPAALQPQLQLPTYTSFDPSSLPALQAPFAVQPGLSQLSALDQGFLQNQALLMAGLQPLQLQQQQKHIAALDPRLALQANYGLPLDDMLVRSGYGLASFEAGGKRKVGEFVQPSLKRPRNSRDVNSIKDEDSDKIRAIISFLERVERPRTWSPEETYCLAQVIIENASLIKQVRYKELHQSFLAKLRIHFNLETKKTRQAFWARHCRIREKLGVEKYTAIFWGKKNLEDLKKELKVESVAVSKVKK